MKKIKRIIELIGNIGIARMLLSFYWNGYLREIGWFKSYRQQKPVNERNEPLPWVTYSFIDFIQPRLTKSMIVLEFGSGYSTLFYSRLVKQVYSVEHDQDWYTEMTKNIPSNATIIHAPLEYGGDYAAFASTIPVKADLIVVDGRDRINCVKESVKALSDASVIVLDDSERDEYREAIDFLLSKGFRKIDFWGIAPGIFFKKCTTLFYRDQNCVGI